MLRRLLLPVLLLLLAACADYTARTKRIITFEYTLVAGRNDQPRHAERLVRLLRPLQCRVNLIPLSPVPHFDGAPPDPAACDRFQAVLTRAGIHTTLRHSRGRQADAARLRQRITELLGDGAQQALEGCGTDHGGLLRKWCEVGETQGGHSCPRWGACSCAGTPFGCLPLRGHKCPPYEESARVTVTARHGPWLRPSAAAQYQAEVSAKC